MAALVPSNYPESDFLQAHDDDDAVSIATTALASEVGSFVGESQDAFLRSITFLKGLDWGIELVDPVAKKTRGLRGQNQKPVVKNIAGCIAMSKIQPGDRIKSINDKRMGASFNADRAMKLIQKCINDEGILSIVVGNDFGDDVLVTATLIKPRSSMTCMELGLTVWYWGTLCIKSLEEDSLISKSALKEADELVSINNINCWGTKVTPEGFSHVVDQLPDEITIVVKRGKQRWSGKFG